MSDIYDLKQGVSPLIVSMPHSGESLGPFAPCMSDAAHQIADTDWHLPALYDFLDKMDVTVLAARHSRYVIDVNRDPSGKSLYPGQNVTELCPTTTFADEPIYQSDGMPDEVDLAERTGTYWHPYHRALQTELERLKALHGYALLWDAHSIASKVPRFFDGRLPDFNIGTNGGKSCGAGLGELLLAIAQTDRRYSAVLNERFRGGYITRHYGNVREGVHAVQLELSQITYMQEQAPFPFDADKAGQVRGVIKQMIEALLAWQPKE